MTRIDDVALSLEQSLRGMEEALVFTRAILLASLTAILAMPARGAEPALLLSSKFGDLCSICAAMLRCTSEAADTPTTLYTFHKLTFAGQMATIFDYFPGTRPPTQERPVTIAPEGGVASKGTAVIDRQMPRILVPTFNGAATEIDRKSGAWRQGDTVLGNCVFVPRARRTESAQK